MAVQRSVKRETFGGSSLGSLAFHLSRLIFHGSCERCENDAWEKARLGALGLGG
jgi:hypothetical protein